MNKPIKTTLRSLFFFFSPNGLSLQKLLSTEFLEIFFSILKKISFVLINIISLFIISFNLLDATKTFYLAYKL